MTKEEWDSLRIGDKVCHWREDRLWLGTVRALRPDLGGHYFTWHPRPESYFARKESIPNLVKVCLPKDVRW